MTMPTRSLVLYCIFENELRIFKFLNIFRIKKKWKDLDLWDQEPGSWSLKYPIINLSSTEKKRQNVIYGFIFNFF